MARPRNENTTEQEPKQIPDNYLNCEEWRIEPTSGSDKADFTNGSGSYVKLKKIKDNVRLEQGMFDELNRHASRLSPIAYFVSA